MAEQIRRNEDDIARTPGPDEASEGEQERVRSFEDRDQPPEPADERAPDTRGYDETARQDQRDTDPDSAESDVHRGDEPVE